MQIYYKFGNILYILLILCAAVVTGSAASAVFPPLTLVVFRFGTDCDFPQEIILPKADLKFGEKKAYRIGFKQELQ